MRFVNTYAIACDVCENETLLFKNSLHESALCNIEQECSENLVVT